MMEVNRSIVVDADSEMGSFSSGSLTLPETQWASSVNQLKAQLTERIKDLECLYRLTDLIERNENSLDKILQEAVKLLPASWQYPEIACARIGYRDQVYASANFKETQWRLEAPIMISNRQEGIVEVRYLKKKPAWDEGPFLKEERLLIDAVSCRIAKTAERISTYDQLQHERQALQNANADLHDFLVQSQSEKILLGQSIQAKINKVVSPIFYALQATATADQLSYMELLKKNLDNIVSPFSAEDGESLSLLTPTELQIANMIKLGFSTKEIANTRGISPATVNRHRESIRRKLGITNSKVNLVSYLNKSEPVQPIL